jgi:hypothetical protein
MHSSWHRPRPSHPAPNVRDDREAPLFRERDGGESAFDLPDVTSENACGTLARRANQPRSTNCCQPQSSPIDVRKPLLTRRAGFFDLAFFRVVAAQAFKCLLVVADRRGCDHAHPAFRAGRSVRTFSHGGGHSSAKLAAIPESCGTNTSHVRHQHKSPFPNSPMPPVSRKTTEG